MGEIHKIILWILLFIILLSLILISFTTQKKPPHLHHVSVAKVIRKDVAHNVTIPSIFSAHSHITLRTRIDGQVKTTSFQEGDIVEKDALLFTLDDDLLQAQLKQAQASLDKNTAAFAFAEKELKRQQALQKKDFASQSIPILSAFR